MTCISKFTDSYYCSTAEAQIDNEDDVNYNQGFCCGNANQNKVPTNSFSQFYSFPFDIYANYSFED
jgi:hypothetical protein